jgi:hypothetical protein
MRIKHLWTRRIFADGRHNAFTGIARFGEHYYVCFRNSESHKAPTSRIFVIRSAACDLERWEQVADLFLDGDSRDPMLLAVGDALHVYFHNKQDYASRSVDGTNWSSPEPIDVEFPATPPGCALTFKSDRRWLFRFREGPDGAYYSAGRCGIDQDGYNQLLLYRSEDGLRWKATHDFEKGVMTAVPRYRNGHETDLAFLDGGLVVAAIRTAYQGLLAVSKPPYDHWEGAWSGIENFGGPVLWPTPHGLLLAARQYSSGGAAQTMVWSVTDCHLHNPYPVPSGGDCSYPGFADGPGGQVLMSYYSSHEWPCKEMGDGPAGIYLGWLDVSPGPAPRFP